MADPIPLKSVSRRTVLKGIVGTAGLVSVPAIIAACSSPAATTAPSTGASAAAPSAAAPSEAAPSVALGPLSIGSYHSDPGEKAGMEAVNAAFTAETGIAVNMNTVDHGTFQDQLANYLGGTPDTAYTWFSGFRMKFFADQGFNTAIDDVWASVKSNYTEGFANSVVGNDGKVYGVPVDYYPWCVFYRKSLFADKGYAIPATWDDLIALSKKMQADGLTPIAFGDKDGWPAMGTFDILNLRINGYDFHVGLMAGSEKWTDPKITTVFQKWAEILPYHAKDYAGLTWQNAADTVVQKKSGMYLLGLFVSSQFAATKRSRRSRGSRLLPLPEPGHRIRCREGAGCPDRYLGDFLEVAEPRHRARCRQGLSRVLGQGFDPADHVRQPARRAANRQRRRHQHLQPAAEEGRRDHRRRATDHAVPRSRHPVRLRRIQRHAELPAEVPRRPEPGPRRLSEVHPGLLGFAASARLAGLT